MKPLVDVLSAVGSMKDHGEFANHVTAVEQGLQALQWVILVRQFAVNVRLHVKIGYWCRISG